MTVYEGITVEFIDDSGDQHCLDGPAVIWEDGCAYYRHGKCHRDGDLPAVILKNGCVEYWANGCRHRRCGRPAVIRPVKNDVVSDVEYWEDGQFIRRGRERI